MKQSLLKSYFVVSFTILWVILSIFLISKLEIDNHPNLFFPKDNKQVLLQNEMKKMFYDDQVFLMFFHNKNLLNSVFLNNLENFITELENLPEVDMVKTINRMDHVEATEDGFTVTPLANIRKGESIDIIKNRIQKNRHAKGLVIDNNFEYLLLEAIPITTATSQDRAKINDAYKTLIKKHNLERDLFGISGGAFQDIAEDDAINRDTQILNPLTLLIGIILIYYLFKSLIAVFYMIIALIIIVPTTLSLYFFFGQPFTSASEIVPPIISALTIAAVIHFFHAINKFRKDFSDKNMIITKAVSHVKYQLLYTSLTTMLGLFSLSSSACPPIKYFGLVSGLGTIALFPLLVFILPHFMGIIGIKGFKAKEEGALLSKIVNFLFEFSIKRPVKILLITLVLMLISSPFIFKVKIETNILKYFDDDHYINVATREIQKHLSGTTALGIFIESTKEDGVLEPRLLNQMKEVDTWLETLPQVDRSISVVEIIEDMNSAFNQDKKEYISIPDNKELILQYLFINNGKDLYDMISKNHQSAKMAVLANVHGASEIGKLVTAIEAKVKPLNDSTTTWNVGGFGRLFSDQIEMVTTSQIKGLILSCIMMFLVMLFIWRKFSDGVLTYIPNFLPVMFIFISMGVLNIWLDAATALIASLIAGISVDDTIYLFYGFKNNIKKGIPPLEALRLSYQESGSSVTATTIILCLQYLIFIFASYTPVRNFGLLTCIGIASAWAFDIIVLPCLVMIFYKIKQA